MISRKILATALLAAIAVPVAYYLASPLFISVRVNEQLPAQPGPRLTVLADGDFVGGDSFHKASGVAKLVRTADGNYVVRLENFQVTNGPDLYVYLSTGKDGSSGFLSLGRLKGNIGDQNYDVPPGTSLEGYRYVLIWCKAFSVLFGHAQLEPAAKGQLPGY